MSKPFRHFVITRFNLKRKIPTSAEWLQRRIELFEKYSLPSIQSQTEKDFFWLVLFDKDVPKNLQEKIDAWQKSCNNFNPMLCGGWIHKTIGGCVEEFIRTETERDRTSYTLTTRIDNDDGMHEDFVKTLQATAHGQIKKGVGAVVLDYCLGVRYHEATKRFLLWPRRCAPFISLLRKYNPEGRIVTVHSFPGGHDSVWKYAKVVSLKKHDPYWLQSIHDVNISNVLTGREKEIARKDLKGFEWLK